MQKTIFQFGRERERERERERVSSVSSRAGILRVGRNPDNQEREYVRSPFSLSLLYSTFLFFFSFSFSFSFSSSFPFNLFTGEASEKVEYRENFFVTKMSYSYEELQLIIKKSKELQNGPGSQYAHF